MPTSKNFELGSFANNVDHDPSTGDTQISNNITLTGELRGPSTFIIDPAGIGLRSYWLLSVLEKFRPGRIGLLGVWVCQNWLIHLGLGFLLFQYKLKVCHQNNYFHQDDTLSFFDKNKEIPKEKDKLKLLVVKIITNYS